MADAAALGAAPTPATQPGPGEPPGATLVVELPLDIAAALAELAASPGLLPGHLGSLLPPASLTALGEALAKAGVGRP